MKTPDIVRKLRSQKAALLAEDNEIHILASTVYELYDSISSDPAFARTVERRYSAKIKITGTASEIMESIANVVIPNRYIYEIVPITDKVSHILIRGK